MSDRIDITLNGKATRIREKTTVEELLNSLDLKGRQVAVELNGEIMSRDRWPEAVLAPRDRLEVVHFVGGGGEGYV